MNCHADHHRSLFPSLRQENREWGGQSEGETKDKGGERKETKREKKKWHEIKQ